MKTAFHGEGNPSTYGSGLSGAYLQTPPPDHELSYDFMDGLNGTTPPSPGHRSFDGLHVVNAHKSADFGVTAWMEVWDYAGGASFRAFLVDGQDEKSLFVFFDIEGVMGRDLKKALMALIELADGPLECSRVVTCIDRRMPVDEAVELTKSLQWVGFELSTLDDWAKQLDATSDRWVYMSMDI